MGGGGGNYKKKLLEKLNEPDEVVAAEKQQLITDSTPHISKIRFEPNHYTVLENAGYVTLHVLRTDGNLRNTIYVDYMTEDGTATHGTDYEPAEGTLIFYPMETHKQIQVKIIDDDIFEEGNLDLLVRNSYVCLVRSVDEHFSVKLSNLKIKDNQGRLTPGVFDKTVQLVEPSTAVVMIIDDDHAGMFVFENDERTVVEADRHIEIKVLRTSGARGCVRIPFATEDETATNGRDYIAHSGEVFFENNESEYVFLLSLTLIRFARLVNIMSIDTVLFERRSANYILAGGETESFFPFINARFSFSRFSPFSLVKRNEGNFFDRKRYLKGKRENRHCSLPLFTEKQSRSKLSIVININVMKHFSSGSVNHH